MRLTTGLGLGFIILAGLLVGAVGLYESSLVRTRQLDLLQAQLLRQARLMAAEVAEALATGDPVDADATAKALGRQLGLRVTVLNTQGRVVGDSASDPTRLGAERSRPEVQAVLKGNLYGVGLDRTRFYVAIPVEFQGELVGFLRVGEDLGPAEGAGNEALTAAGVALAAAVPLGLLFGLVGASLTRRSTGRIVQGLRRLMPAEAEAADPVRAVSDLVADLRQRVGRLEAEHRRLELILDQMADGLVIADFQGNVVQVNPAAARLLQVQPQEAAGRSLVTVLKDHELTAFVRSHIAGQPETSGPRTFEVGPPGQRRVIQVQVSRTGEAGQPDAYLVILLQDITELKQTEQVRRDFVANVSHELRTPVAALKALVESLENGAVEDPEVAKDFIRRLRLEVDGLALLVEELFELARVESGGPALKVRPVDLGFVIRQAVERMQPLADRQGLTLLLRLPTDLPTVEADPDRIQQVVLNLVHNAVKFTPPGGRITVSVERRDAEVAVSVADTGIGIPRELLPRVFERFFKADRSRASGGSGLGLAIAKHIVQAHGGRIWAESAGEGRGSTFTFSLPVRQAG